jgi:cytochrome c peroxidase
MRVRSICALCVGRIVAGVVIGFLAGVAPLAPARAAGDEFRWQLPPGFPQPAVPANNPMTADKVALGARLFADVRLSITGQHSCASCHSPTRAFTDGLARSRGATGETLPLNAPTLLNAAYNASLGWHDTGVRTLEQQMLGPLFNEHPRELGLVGRESVIESELAADAGMARAFVAAFPGESQPVRFENVVRAIAAYERTLIAGGSAFDRYVFAGDSSALDANQKRGMALFFSARTGCSACHGGINFAGEWVDREHVEAKAVFADTGTGEKVRVPTLRNLEFTAPYMHDGRFATLDAVLDHYEKLSSDPAADSRLRHAPLTTDERDALREFLASLSEPSKSE